MHHCQRFSSCDPLLCHQRRYDDSDEEDDDDYHHICTISIYHHHIYKGLLTVEKKDKKNVFNGRILEIEGKKVGRKMGRWVG
jgi:hypothetical protein